MITGKTRQKLTIGHLYGLWMNTYGDDGNLICLKQRCEWRGIEVEIKYIPLMYDIKPKEFDMYFFGGGQDQAQMHLAKDLIQSHKGQQLTKDLEKGVPMLSICGGYQLLGEYYAPFEGPKLEGLDVLPVYTTASHDRMIGNLVVNTMFGDLVGFENHSGKTTLKKGASPLGKVEAGFGNNGADSTEGCIYKNVIGCYMHGSLLPKNPVLADWLIKKALEVKYSKKVELSPLNDALESKAHNLMIKRFRK
jgi:CobQ-like glutamine amidotransferase family enzyme